MKSPGHRDHPDHKVIESKLDQDVSVSINGERVASSHDVVKVEEDGNPARYYFPRSDVAMEKLMRSETQTKCPFKGTAHYFGVRAGNRVLNDAVWSYEEPFEEHQGLKDRVAFYADKFPEIAITQR